MPCAEVSAHTATLDGSHKLSAAHFKTPVTHEEDTTILQQGCLSEQKFSRFAKRWVVLEKSNITGCISLKIYRYSESEENPVQANFKYQYVLTDGEFVGSIKGNVRSSNKSAFSWAIILKSEILQFQDKSRLVCDAWFSAIRKNINYITWEVKTVSGFKSVGQDAIFFLTDYLLAMCHTNLSKVMCAHMIEGVSEVSRVSKNVKFTTDEDGGSCSYEIETARETQAERIVEEITEKRRASLAKDIDENANTSRISRATPVTFKFRNDSFLPVEMFPTPPSTPSKLSPYNISPAGSPHSSPNLPRHNPPDTDATIESEGTVEKDREDSNKRKSCARIKEPGEHDWKRTNAFRRRRRPDSKPKETDNEQPSVPTPDKTPPVPIRPAWTLKPKTRHLSMDQSEKVHHSSTLSHSLSAAMFSHQHKNLHHQKSVGCAVCVSVCTCGNNPQGPVLPPRINIPGASNGKQSSPNTSMSSVNSLGDNLFRSLSKSSGSNGEHYRPSKHGPPSGTTGMKQNSSRNVVLGGSQSPYQVASCDLEETFLSMSPELSPPSSPCGNYFFGGRDSPNSESSFCAKSPYLPSSPRLSPRSQSDPHFPNGSNPVAPSSPRIPEHLPTGNAPPPIPLRDFEIKNHQTNGRIYATPQEERPPIPARTESLNKSDGAEAISVKTISPPKPVPRRKDTSHPSPPPRSQSTSQSLHTRRCVVCPGPCQCAQASVHDFVSSIETNEHYLDMVGQVDHYIRPYKGEDPYITPDVHGEEHMDTYLVTGVLSRSLNIPSTSKELLATRPKQTGLPVPKTGTRKNFIKHKGKSLSRGYAGDNGSSSDLAMRMQFTKSCSDLHSLAEKSGLLGSTDYIEESIQASSISREGRTRHPIPHSRPYATRRTDETLYQLLFEYISRRAPPLDHLGVSSDVWAHFLIALDCENSAQGLNDWRGLAVFMGLSDTDMKWVDEQCRKSDRIASEFILLYWAIHREPILPYTKENLFDVLISLKRQDLVKILENK